MKRKIFNRVGNKVSIHLIDDLHRKTVYSNSKLKYNYGLFMK